MRFSLLGESPCYAIADHVKRCVHDGRMPDNFLRKLASFCDRCARQMANDTSDRHGASVASTV